jgi:hypothetical protein
MGYFTQSPKCDNTRRPAISGLLLKRKARRLIAGGRAAAVNRFQGADLDIEVKAGNFNVF